MCIPNYPDKNLPTLFVYFENDLKKQFVGPLVLGGMNLKQDGELCGGLGGWVWGWVGCVGVSVLGGSE